MRHGKKINHLGRTSAHRKAMLANMASSLIMHKRINTTLAKAKALRVYVEPLITKSKEDSTNSRRVVFSYLQDKFAVTELFREVATKIAQRPGGYTRILKTGNRLGDNAEMCLIELVDYNENLLGTKQDKKAAKSTTRRKSSAKKKTETTDVELESAPKEKVAKAKVEKKPKAEETSETQTPEVAE
ncbi:MAG: 50S ribosomal protein L17 [Bacteroidetes bacterium]|nr:50S ribosomal protein L17 [Bacteroidota bacterium]